MDRNHDVKTFTSKYLYLEKAGVANFADIIKIATMFIKSIFKDSKKVTRIRNYILKGNLYLFLLFLLIVGDKMPMQAEFKGYVT